MHKHARRGATGGSAVREGAGPRSGGRFVLRTLEGSAFRERGGDARTAAARRRRGDRGADPFQQPLQKSDKRGRRGGCDDPNTSESGTPVRHGLCRHRRVHPHTRVHAHAGALPAAAVAAIRCRCRVASVRAYVTRIRMRATRAYVFVPAYLRQVSSFPAGTARRGAARRDVDEVKAKQARSYRLITN